jgi:putative PIG3 family NAD(P)H quinone oxidoreductase
VQAIVFNRPGGPEVLRLAERPDPVPGDREVLVRVRAAGVNRADLLQRMGRYPPPAGASEILGLELAGEVVALGRGCTRRRVGERVMALVTGGAYATLAVAPEPTTMLVPPRLSWREAAATPEAFLTAFLNLFDLGRLGAGEWVLVHAGASGVGSAAIQLARAAGARVLATAGTDAKLVLCRSLGAEFALHRERDDFAARAVEASGGDGIHLVLDVVGAPYWASNLHALRTGGRLMLVGFLGGSRGDVDLAPVLRKSLVVRGTTLRGMALAAKANLVARSGDFILPRLADGRLRAIVDRAFPLAQAAAAHAYMIENRNLGNIVLETSA